MMGLRVPCASLLQVNPEPYIDICLYDTCACESVGDCACFCDTVAAYAHTCAQKGVTVHWRSQTLCRKYRKHDPELGENLQGFGSDWSDLALLLLTPREFNVNGADAPSLMLPSPVLFLYLANSFHQLGDVRACGTKSRGRNSFSNIYAHVH